MNFGSTKGRWTAFIPAMYNRYLCLHLFYKSHATDAQAVVSGTGATKTTEQVKEYRVEFTMVEINRDDPDPSPALKGAGGFPPDDNDVLAFLQAVVDEAAKVGIRASGTENLEDVLGATTNHLEDMRRLVFTKEGGYMPMGEKLGTRS